MATPAEIIAAIDTAILAWCGKPVTISQNGLQVTYRSLTELTAARTYYSGMLHSQGASTAFQIHEFAAGGEI